jgi:peptide/nickel transport system substrate-binding protein
MLKPTRRSTALLGAVAAAGLLTAGCTSSSADATGSESPAKRIVVDWATGNTTLDPAAACNQDDLSLIHNTYATLTEYGTKDGPEGTSQYDPKKIVPSFATKWAISSDGKTYTFTLRPEAKFSDGSPMDAEAVKFSVERVLGSGTCAGFYLQAGDIIPNLIKKVEAPDATTVIFTLARPSGDFLAGLATPAGSIVNPKVVNANGGVQPNTRNEYMASHIAGGGPYVLASYAPNNKAVLKANANYYGNPPKTPEIEINYVTSASTLLLKAKSKAADVTLGMPLQSLESLKSNDCCTIIDNPAPSFAQVALKNTMAPLNNVQFRKGLTLAVPYEDILKNVAYGYGSLFYGPVVPAAVGYDADGSKQLQTDLGAAKAAIVASGVKTPVDLTMIVNSTSPVAVQLATAIQGVWKEIGVNLKVQALAPAEFTPKYTGGDYQTVLNIEGPGVPTAGYQLTLTAKCDSPFNNAKVCVDGLDQLLVKARAASDQAEADRYYAQITDLWREQYPRIPLYSADNVTVLSKSVKNFSYAKFLDFSSWTVQR